MPLLELKNITKHFSGVRALDGVSFILEKGEVHALCGENGAGKSTLIKILCGYHSAGTYGGEVCLEGRQVFFKNIHDSEKAGIALIAQELALVPELSVIENMVLGREPSRYGLIQWKMAETQCRKALDEVGLSINPRALIKTLGIGQQQMVEIAKALSKNAGILVLDEPTAALAENDTERLLTLLHQLKVKGISCVYISHRLEEVMKIADRVTILRDGQSVATSPVAQMPREKIIANMVGREVKNLYPRTSSFVGQTLLAVQNFSVTDPENTERKVVDHVSFEIRAGEILGIAGLMGSGRTALLSSLFGAARGQVQGILQLDGRNRGPFQSPGEAIRDGMVLVSEDRKRYGLVSESTVRENLVLATLRKWVRNGLLNWTVIQEICEAQIRDLSIKTSSLLIWVNKLSGGNQQKVVLGKWLMAHPRILLLDEPTRGIDVGAKVELYELIGKLTGQGIGIVLVSSDLPELLGLSHRIMVLNQGRVSARLSMEEASPERVMEAATTHSFHPVTV